MNTGKSERLTKAYAKKSFDSLVVKRVKFGVKLSDTIQDVKIYKAKEEYLKKNREMEANCIPFLDEFRRGNKAGIIGAAIGVGVGLGLVGTGIVPSDALDDTIPQVILAGGIPGGVLGLGVGHFVGSTPKMMTFIEDKKLSINSLKQRIAEKKINNLETKVEALNSAIREKYENVNELVCPENVELKRYIPKDDALFEDEDFDDDYEDDYEDDFEDGNDEGYETVYESDEFGDDYDETEEDFEEVSNVTPKRTITLPKINVGPYDPNTDTIESNTYSENGSDFDL